MNPDAVAVLIPIVAIGGFFALMIVRTFTKAYTAKLQAGGQAGPAHEARQEEVAAGPGGPRREVGGLAGPGEFSGRRPPERGEGRPAGAPPRRGREPPGGGGRTP